MPVTAKLSKQFYEKLGDDIANELVDWFNQVDLTYRDDVRTLNEATYARFEAKLDQRLAEFESAIRQELAGLRSEFLADLGELRGELRAGLGELRGELRAGLGELRGEMNAATSGLRGELRGELRGSLAALRADLIKWMFVFWAGSTLTMVGLGLTLARSLRP